MLANLGGLLFWLAVGKIAGAAEIGYATGAISLGLLLSALGNIGLNYACLREVPERRARAYSATLALAVVCGALLSTTSVLFSNLYGGFSQYIPLVVLITILGLANLVSTSALIASLNYKKVFVVNLASITTKLTLGITLVFMGLGGLGIVFSVVSAQTAAFILSVALATLAVGLTLPTLNDLAEILRIGLPNYPQIFSTQLITSAGIVLIALLTGSPEQTGIFYMALMITVALTYVPGSMASITLPLMVRTHNHQLANQSLRLGGAIILPVAVAIAVAAEPILAIINPQFTAGAATLIVLTLSIVPQATILNAISKLNTEKNMKKIAEIGLLRLLTLTLLVTALAPTHGALGAAIAYLASTLTPIPLLRRELELTHTAKLATLQVFTLALALALPAKPLIVSAAAATATLALLHLTQTLTIPEALSIIKTVVKG